VTLTVKAPSAKTEAETIPATNPDSTSAPQG